LIENYDMKDLKRTYISFSSTTEHLQSIKLRIEPVDALTVARSELKRRNLRVVTPFIPAGQSECAGASLNRHPHAKDGNQDIGLPRDCWNDGRIPTMLSIPRTSVGIAAPLDPFTSMSKHMMIAHGIMHHHKISS